MRLLYGLDVAGVCRGRDSPTRATWTTQESGRSVRLGPSPVQVRERPAPPGTCPASAPDVDRPAHSTLTVSGYLPVVLLDLDVPDVLPLMCGQVWVVPFAAYRDMRLYLPAPYDARDIV